MFFPARIRREPRLILFGEARPNREGRLPLAGRVADPEVPEGGWRAPNPSGATTTPLKRKKKNPSRWFVYAVRCRDGSIYTGITTDLARRIKTHNAGKGGAYTRSRRPVRLVFREAQPTLSAALKRDARIKGWSRAEKIKKLLKGRSGRSRAETGR